MKISKGESEAVNQRRTANTMSRRKRTKGQTAIYKTLNNKTKDRSTQTPLNIEGIELLWTGQQSLLHMWL